VLDDWPLNFSLICNSVPLSDCDLRFTLHATNPNFIYFAFAYLVSSE
jgi:hypothetical protein